MLNIGRLSPGAAEYYVGEVASSAEDYYTGRGEAAGRWAGSLAGSMGLDGTVEPEHFRAVLDGRHPFTLEQLAPTRNYRARTEVQHRDQASLFERDTLDVARTAARLGVTIQRVRQLVYAGKATSIGPGERYLRGVQPGGKDSRWRIERSEVERYEAAHLGPKARPGYDLTLRPPKSVSVLWALSPEVVRREIRRAHAEAVDAVVGYVEGHALYARKFAGKAPRERIATDGVIAAVFDHRTSRAGDPLLHSHVVVANLTRTVEGRWRAIDGRPLFEHARPAGVLYQAHLRHLLAARLGMQWGKVRNGWAEVEGVPAEVVRVFSKRRDEIEAMVAESGYSSAKAHQTATLATRRAKDYRVDPDELVNRWRAEAEALGFGPEGVAGCLDPDRVADQDGDRAGQGLGPAEVAALHGFLGGPEGLTRMASTFTRKEVIEAVADRVPASCSAADIEVLVDGFLSSGHAQGLSPDGAAREWVWRRGGSKERDVDLARWSTPGLLGMEADLERWAAEGFGVPPAVPRAATVEALLASRPTLSVEQVAMVRGLASPDAGGVQVVSGRPGSGKTFATATYVQALVADGIPVVGCSLAATAAAELEASCDFRSLTGREASTVARLLSQLVAGRLPAGTVVVVDEASMVGTRDLHRLAGHVQAAGGCLKLIGDPSQHGAVETGGFYRHLCEQAADGLVELVENNRQTDTDDQRSVEEFRDGRIEAALARYDVNGQIHRAATAPEAFDLMVDHWVALVEDGGADPMIAGPNRVRRELNRRARRHMDSTGRLTGPTLTAADGVDVQAGDWLVARRNQPGVRGPGGWVKNGSAGTVAAVDVDRRTVTVDFVREGRITLPGWYLDEAGWVEHGYARTTYGVQGATLERALYIAGDEASFEEGYVAFTRGRTETRLYLVAGTAAGGDEDGGHRAHAGRATGLHTVAVALGRTRANHLAHDADPDASGVAAYAGWRLDRLRAERERIEAVMAAGPRNVTEQHDEATTALEEALARRRVHAGHRPGSSRLDDEIARLEARIEVLAATLAARDAYRAKHPAEVAAYPLVRRAELARELLVRANAAVAPPGRVVVALGPPPAQPVARRAWADAAEAVAVHVERYGVYASAPGGGVVGHALGSRPPQWAAAFSWERAADAVLAADGLASAPERPRCVQVELDGAVDASLGQGEEVSLFD